MTFITYNKLAELNSFHKGVIMIKASKLRKKYFNEEIFTDSAFEELKTLCEKSIKFTYFGMKIWLNKWLVCK